jgi:hypothetical protein
MSVGLKGMVMAGWGLAWIPESLVSAELADGSLVRAADPIGTSTSKSGFIDPGKTGGRSSSASGRCSTRPDAADCLPGGFQIAVRRALSM